MSINLFCLIREVKLNSLKGLNEKQIHINLMNYFCSFFLTKFV